MTGRDASAVGEAGWESLRIAVPSEPAFASFGIADELGLFAQERLKVDYVVVPPGLSALELLVERTVEVIVGSLWFALSRPELDLVCLGQANARCHHVLVARPNPGQDAATEFAESLTTGSRVLIPGHAPTPAAALYAALEEAGVTAGQLRYIPFLDSMAVETEFFDREVGDLALVPLDRAINRRAQLALDVPKRLGPVPWSVLFAQRPMEAGLAERGRRLLRALRHCGEWLAQVAGSELEAVSRRLGWSTEEASSIAAYAALGLWPPTPTVDRRAADRWTAVLQSEGLVKSSVSAEQFRWEPDRHGR